jgi:hypothetical protein
MLLKLLTVQVFPRINFTRLSSLLNPGEVTADYKPGRKLLDHDYTMFIKPILYLLLLTVSSSIFNCTRLNNPFSPTTFDNAVLNTVEIDLSLLDLGTIIQDDSISSTLRLVKYRPGSIDWSYNTGVGWISILPSSGGSLESFSTSISLIVDSHTLEWGTYNEQVEFIFAGGLLPSKEVTVNMQITRPPGIYVHLYGIGGDNTTDLAEMSVSGIPSYPTTVIIHYYTSGSGTYGLNLNDQSIGNLPVTTSRVLEYEDTALPYTKTDYFIRMAPGTVTRNLYIYKIVVDSLEFSGEDITVNGPGADKVLF